jgi:hypothetical protein
MKNILLILVALFLSCTCIAFVSPMNLDLATHCGYKIKKVDTLVTIDTSATGIRVDTLYEIYFRAFPPCEMP